MPTAAQLPDELEPFARRQYIELSETRWDHDVGRLIAAIEAQCPPRPAPRRWSQRVRSRTALLAAVAVIAAGAGGKLLVDALQSGGDGNAGSGTLAVGDTGPAVEELERLLATRGFDPGAIDGHFDGETEQAAKAFQRRAGVAADGVAGGETLRALRD